MTREGEVDLSDMNPRGRFSGRAGDYVRYRPDYPEAALDAILEGLGDPALLTAADVGAGTGISARQLASRGVRVLAVEPNLEMRAAAGAHALIECWDGAAEATGLAPSSVRLVLCAQAFHWFRAREALAEFHRILEPGGRLALMWNSRDRSDPLTRGYVEAIHAVNGEHPAELRPFDPGSIAAGGLFTPPQELRFPHRQTLDLEGLVGRAASASYVPREGPGFERLRALLEEVWKRERDARGMVAMRYGTEVYLADRRSPGTPPLAAPGQAR
ncbi:MAG TPA: class I SAM-dependent methyltransferase [Candidatus Eisenbacteria bacterium]|jgi:SAM-dependent methyltransferase